MEAQAKASNLSSRVWYVVYTRPRWEKKVTQSLIRQGITSYCPLRVVKNKWADRMKLVAIPLFNSYVFVHIDLRDELRIRQTMGVVNFVYFMGKLAVVKEDVIHEIKCSLELYPDAEVVAIQELSIGTRVKIKEGIMERKEGYIVKLHTQHIIVVIDNLNCMMVTRVPVHNLEIIN